MSNVMEKSPSLGTKANKANEFKRILEKIESLEKEVVGLAEQLRSNSLSASLQEKRRKRRARSSGKAWASKRRPTSISLQRVSSLDLLANVVLQVNSRGKPQGSKSEADESSGALKYAENFSLKEVPNFAYFGDFGVFSSYAILTPKGLEWIRSKSINCEEEIGYLGNWYSQFLQSKKSESLFPLPIALQPRPELAVLEALIQVFEKSRLHAMSFAFLDGIQALFKELLEGEAKSLKASKHIVLNVALALVCHFQQHSSKTPIEGMSSEVMETMQNLEALVEMEDNFISNALFYYHQVSIMPEGILTLQAMLALLAYTDFTGALHASYIMVTLAIRLAQDLGLHAEITYEGLDIAEDEKRRKMWGLCRYFDLKLSMILGRPPVVANYDTTTSFPNCGTYLGLLAEVCAGTSANPPTCELSFAKKLLHLVVKETGFDLYGGFHIFRLVRVASRVYSQLYAPSTAINLKKHLASAQALLTEMESFRLSLPDGVRPLSPVKKAVIADLFKVSNLPPTMTQVLIYSIHFLFYMNLMFIQKALFKTQVYLKENGEYSETPFYESVRTARHALSLVAETFEPDMNGYFKPFQWTISMAFFEVFVYTLSKQDDPQEFEHDVRLMAHVQCDFFTRYDSIDAVVGPCTQAHRQNALPSPNLQNNFKHMINVLRKTFSARFGRNVQLTPAQHDCLQYSASDIATTPDREMNSPSMNPFSGVDNMEFFGLDANMFGL
ncbi:fungal specific transcription factor domain-containing protein [Lachancea thermotolerans CBS 6340]|uniref:KLTH0B09746p n=1 Tax=Lachancea thermotolerans (strain ATCC 56472 / CBS 6340 / NRRL Y-8284) TaxID=559295 RepID=C5DDB1_LACTC|nr:KLTH0B09746p [Lachancea thermotolerans CBS 6340]CAR21772.1 KLTH0B09746p [Lachancea thermotolerans CBS 6340]